MNHEIGRPHGIRPGIGWYMDRFIDSIEWIAAFFMGIVAIIVFSTVLLRYFFNFTPPDAYDFSMLMLGIVIFWGIAATSYRGTHITVDLIWAAANPRWQRIIDVFATLVLLFVVVVQTYTLYDKTFSTRIDNVQTFELRWPVWPFYLIAWLGDLSAVLLIAVRTWRLIFRPDLIARDHAAAKKMVE